MKPLLTSGLPRRLTQLTMTAVLVLTVAGCAPIAPTTQHSPVPAPTLNALEQKEMSIKYQREILELVPSNIINPRTSEMPEIGSLKAPLVRCEFDTPYPTQAPVYYSGGFTLVLEDSVDLHAFLHDLNETIASQPERERRTFKTTNPPDRSYWYFGDDYMVGLSVITRGSDGAKMFDASVSSPCFYPEPPYTAGDEI